MSLLYDDGASDADVSVAHIRWPSNAGSGSHREHAVVDGVPASDEDFELYALSAGAYAVISTSHCLEPTSCVEAMRDLTAALEMRSHRVVSSAPLMPSSVTKGVQFLLDAAAFEVCLACTSPRCACRPRHAAGSNAAPVAPVGQRLR